MDALERRGFWYEVDLRFGAIDTLMLTREREGGGGRKKHSEKSQTVQIYTNILNVKSMSM